MQSINILLKISIARIQARYHQTVAITPETLSQQRRQFRLSIWYVLCLPTPLLLSQCSYNLSECKQTLIDLYALFIGCLACMALTLTSGQVYQLEFALDYVIRVREVSGLYS